MNKNLIHTIARETGVPLTVSGLKMTQSSFDYLKPVEMSFGEIKNTCNAFGLDIKTSELDFTYYVSDWSDYLDVISAAYAIVKQFPWTREKWDCDNRANFMTDLCAIFGLTVGKSYCRVYNKDDKEMKYMHYFNVVITDKKEMYFIDADNGGYFTKMEKGKDIIIRDNQYEIISVTFY